MRKNFYLTLVGLFCGMGAFAQEVVTVHTAAQGERLETDTVIARPDTLKTVNDTVRPTMDSLRLLYESMHMLPPDTLKAPKDSLLETTDTLQATDSLRAASKDVVYQGNDSIFMMNEASFLSNDTTYLKPDSTLMSVDSLRLANDTVLAERDSVALGRGEGTVDSNHEKEKAASKKSRRPKQSPAVRAFYQSLNELSASYFAYFHLWDNLDIPVPRRIRPNPGFYKLFVPPTYYEAPIREAFDIGWQPGQKVATPVDSLLMGKRDTISGKYYQLPDLETLAATDRWSNAILRNFYKQHPEMLVNNELYLKDLKPLEDDMIVRAPRKEKFRSLLEPEAPVESVNPDNELLVFRPNFWKHKGNGYLNFTQHYISDNWYKGGESTNALLGGLVLEANFDDRQRLEFENKLELKLGFITAPSDTLHEYKTNADLIRLNSKLGVKAFKNWYYTLAAEFKTQFFANYKTNSDVMISNFMSPAQLELALGMDFKQNKKNYTLSLMGSPLAYTFIYISNDRIDDPTAFNVDAGHKTASLFGSKFTGNLKWQIIPNIIWESKLDYFTTYEKVIANWENTFNFVLNRYLSTKLFVHARFDDGVTLAEDENSYFQLQELLSFGINYTW